MSGDDDSSGWQLTESDPGVFSELLHTLGVPLIVDELWSLDAGALAALQPISAFIFLFKYVASSRDVSGGGAYDPDFAGFFAHQTVNNACATLAVVNALGNIDVQMGSELKETLDFARELDPQSRGMALVSSLFLRAAHNALSPPSVVSLDGLNLPKRTEDAYHFVVYLPVNGALYELDGLKEHAVRHAAVSEGERWVDVARETIEARIATYPQGAIEFSLMALRPDPLPALQAQLAERPGDEMLLSELTRENEKRQRWAVENALRKANHLPLIHALVAALSKSGGLDAAVSSAKEKMRQRLSSGQAMEED
ncbi:cysteine proteinase [Auricularia subglabra TFB-10046 SS5]|uniref:Ubiquitin carboxyl-terminal hydrolase n=1 Tax=Auricularia subglabra (strain TFB-10046 / SS5) TaxID=717982 RepID=J0CZJ9_AURST|nr:cysteine proteinase [Auricularia subglabra TFB-10046 SS5]